MRKLPAATWLSATFLTMFGSAAYGHSTPADFAELSLQDLVELEVDETADNGGNRWSFSYQFSHLEIEGYRDGTDDLSTADVLWEASSGEPRTAKNFPVLPTEIKQEVHVFDLNYRLTNNTALRLSVPYIRQSTDHISIVPNYPEFLIKSSGLGDTKVAVTRDLGDAMGGTWRLSAGISFPTGSIDEEGDTPRAPGDQQLPYTMQLGSGTYDVPISVNYQRTSELGKWNFGLSATLRNGENDRDYRLGNSYLASARFSLPTSWGAEPFIATDARYIAQIKGRDEELIVPNPTFPYPASITNPDLYGGTIVTLKLGVKLPVGPDESTLIVDVGAPLYQHLNGPQPKARWTAGLKYVFSL